MFESDDFDQVLSQFDFPEIPSTEIKNGARKDVQNIENTVESTLPLSLPKGHSEQCEEELEEKLQENNFCTKNCTKVSSLQVAPPSLTLSDDYNATSKNTFISPKHTKRKIINSHFDHKIKRKFPGPAGLLTGTLVETKDETVCDMELLSQDIEFSHNNLRGDLFESPLWLRLLNDIKVWDLNNIDNIKSIKQQALAGNLRRRKAQTVTAFIETIDRSATDPLVILRDATGHIKCTLHRDAWSSFSTYIVSEYCALILWKPTVLTTGGTFKRHYLNITLSNIYAIYSSAVVKEDRQLPDGFVIVVEDNYTVIKTEITPQDLVPNQTGCNGLKEGAAEENLLNDLDSIFSDDLF